MALLVIHGPHGVSNHTLLEHTWIGRLEKNTITIDDARVSGEHCLIYFDTNRGHVLRDLKSRNGTFVNGARVESEVLLRGGDDIRIGSSRCVFIASVSSANNMIEFGGGPDQTHIHTRLASQEEKQFLPEKKVRNNAALRADYEKLRLTYELQRDIGPTERIDVTLGRILERTFEFLHYDHGVILLADPDGELRAKAHKVREGMGKVLISTTVLRHVQEEKQGIISTDASVDERFRTSESIIVQGVRSTIAVPILSNDELLGVMVVDSVASPNAFTEKDLLLISSIANQTAQILRNTMLHEELKLSFDNSIRTLAAMVDARHQLTAGHSERVTVYAQLIADEIGLESGPKEVLYFAALLHDIGKIGIADRVLQKNGPFTPDEQAEMNTHPEKTRAILEKFHFPSALEDVPAVAASHHERLDGTGYPQGRKGKELSLLSRILAVADVFDALSSRRDYPKYTMSQTLGNEPMPLAAAIDIIRSEAGAGFDERVVEAFIRSLPRALIRFRGTHFPPEYVDETVQTLAPGLLPAKAHVHAGDGVMKA